MILSIENKINIVFFLVVIICSFFSCHSNSDIYLCRNSKAVKQYIENNGDPNLILMLRNSNHSDGEGKVSLLFCAIYEQQDLSLAKFLIDKGASVNLSYGKFGNTVFHVIQNPETTEFLLEQGADVNVKNGDGKVALHEAVSGAAINEQHKQVMLKISDLLISRGADVNAKDNEGRTPLHYPFEEALAKILLENGADVNAQDVNSMTPLHTASIYCQSDVVKTLIENQADASIKDKQGRMPLDIAVFDSTGGCHEIVLILSEYIDSNEH